MVWIFVFPNSYAGILTSKAMVLGAGIEVLMIRISAHNSCLVSINEYALFTFCMLQPNLSKFLYLRSNFEICHQIHLFSYTNSSFLSMLSHSDHSKIHCNQTFIFCVNLYVKMLNPQASLNLLVGKRGVYNTFRYSMSTQVTAVMIPSLSGTITNFH